MRADVSKVHSAEWDRIVEERIVEEQRKLTLEHQLGGRDEDDDCSPAVIYRPSPSRRLLHAPDAVENDAVRIV